MTPPLPPELLSEILSLASEGQGPAKRQKTRKAFRLVCRAWRDSFEFANEVNLVGLNELVAFSTLLAVAPAAGGRTSPALKIRRLAVELAELEHRIEPKLGALVLAGVLGQANEVDHLELKLCSEAAGDHESVELYPVLVGAMARLSVLRHLSIASVDKRFLACSVSQLNRLAQSWPELINLHLDRVSLLDSAPLGQTQLPALGRLARLRSARFARCLFDAVALDTVLRQLPKTITSLSLAPNTLYEAEHVQVVHAHLPAFAPRLVSLALLFRDDSRPRLRGAFDGPLRQLGNLRKLAICPCAVKNLSAAVASLPHLHDLVLQQGYARPPRPLEHDEVVLLILRPSSLQRIIIGASISAAWSARGRDVVREAAKVKGVKVTWLRRGEAPL